MTMEETESTNHELNQCHRDLDDAIKKSTTNSVLMRYMRSRNIQLETLVNELQSFVDIQRKEIESYQSSSKSPLQVVLNNNKWIIIICFSRSRLLSI